ncbi:MAG: hypothetical protein J5826_00065, partial [Bacteroidales bacterium]|nr:hypothetical protein [Bacteroidales bacterium]
MKFTALADRTEYFLRRLSKRAKSWLVLAVWTAAILMLLFGTLWIYNHIKFNRERAEYERKLQTSQQNYYTQTVENANLEKRLQDMNLRLAQTIGSMVELQTMLDQINSEKANLEEVKRQLETGLKTTRTQLDKVQKSVN